MIGVMPMRLSLQFTSTSIRVDNISTLDCAYENYFCNLLVVVAAPPCAK